MSHRFVLNPNPTLLKDCGFLIDWQFESLSNDLNRHGYVVVEIEAVYTEEHRAQIENDFTTHLITYDLTEHRDTLLYVALLEGGYADSQLKVVHNTYKQRLRDKQLAQFLQLYSPDAKHKPSGIKVSTLTDTVKVTDSDILEWMGDLLKEFLEEGNFIPGLHGDSLFKFTLTNEGKVGDHGKLNYQMIDQLASQTIRKPGIRDRNKYLASFLYNLWNVLDSCTPLSTGTNMRFSDDQLNFLFDVAVTFGWLNELTYDSSNKDYMYTLLVNHTNRK